MLTSPAAEMQKNVFLDAISGESDQPKAKKAKKLVWMMTTVSFTHVLTTPLDQAGGRGAGGECGVGVVWAETHGPIAAL